MAKKTATTKTAGRIPPMPKGEAVARFAMWCQATGRDIPTQARNASNGRTSVPFALTATEIGDLLGYVEMTGTADIFMAGR